MRPATVTLTWFHHVLNREEEEAFNTWYMTKTPLGKKFHKRQEERDEAIAPTAGKKGAGKAKKGKKGKKKRKKKN
jgi:hypothetical protein